MSVWITSGRTLFFIHVEVVAIRPSTSNWLRVDEKPHHGHLIVGLVGDVGHDDHALLLHVGIDAGSNGIRRGWLLRRQPNEQDGAEEGANHDGTTAEHAKVEHV